MDIRFQASTTRAGVDLAAHARRCLQVGMQHRSDRVEHIEVRFGDARERRPHQDSYCIVRLKLHGVSAATVVQVGADAYSAIDRAADRACRLAEEQLRLAGLPKAWPAAPAIAFVA